MKKIVSICLCLIILSLPIANVFGENNWEINIGGKASALSGAFTAIADDVSALYYNPAGIIQIPESMMSTSVTNYSSYNNYSDHVSLSFMGFVLPTSSVTLGIINVIPIDDRYYRSSSYGWRDERDKYEITKIACAFPLKYGSVGLGLSIVRHESKYEDYYDYAGYYGQTSHWYKRTQRGTGWEFDASLLLNLTERLKMGAVVKFPYYIYWNGETEYKYQSESYPDYSNKYSDNGEDFYPLRFSQGIAYNISKCPDKEANVIFEIENRRIYYDDIIRPFEAEANYYYGYYSHDLYFYKLGAIFSLSEIFELRLGIRTDTEVVKTINSSLGFELKVLNNCNIEYSYTRSHDYYNDYQTLGVNYRFLK